ncbi:MAG: hypothetical protein M5R36_26065 [Deltaproteobacteria bacterium]|nr:hypothetical protein [Deltaproteobacteria bacterium]
MTTRPSRNSTTTPVLSDDDTGAGAEDDEGDVSLVEGGSCSCSGCEGCKSMETAFALLTMVEDFEALHPDYGADELGYYLDEELADATETELFAWTIFSPTR